jgi:hypothetical protein
VAPLRFTSPSPSSGWTEDFHLQAVVHTRHTKTKAARRRLPIFKPDDRRSAPRWPAIAAKSEVGALVGSTPESGLHAAFG